MLKVKVLPGHFVRNKDMKTINMNSINSALSIHY